MRKLTKRVLPAAMAGLMLANSLSVTALATDGVQEQKNIDQEQENDQNSAEPKEPKIEKLTETDSTTDEGYKKTETDGNTTTEQTSAEIKKYDVNRETTVDGGTTEPPTAEIKKDGEATTTTYTITDTTVIPVSDPGGEEEHIAETPEQAEQAGGVVTAVVEVETTVVTDIDATIETKGAEKDEGSTYVSNATLPTGKTWLTVSAGGVDNEGNETAADKVKIGDDEYTVKSNEEDTEEGTHTVTMSRELKPEQSVASADELKKLLRLDESVELTKLAVEDVDDSDCVFYTYTDADGNEVTVELYADRSDEGDTTGTTVTTITLTVVASKTHKGSEEVAENTSVVTDDAGSNVSAEAAEAAKTGTNVTTATVDGKTVETITTIEDGKKVVYTITYGDTTEDASLTNEQIWKLLGGGTEDSPYTYENGKIYITLSDGTTKKEITASATGTTQVLDVTKKVEGNSTTIGKDNAEKQVKDAALKQALSNAAAEIGLTIDTKTENDQTVSNITVADDGTVSFVSGSTTYTFDKGTNTDGKTTYTAEVDGKTYTFTLSADPSVETGNTDTWDANYTNAFVDNTNAKYGVTTGSTTSVTGSVTVSGSEVVWSSEDKTKNAESANSALFTNGHSKGQSITYDGNNYTITEVDEDGYIVEMSREWETGQWLNKKEHTQTYKFTREIVAYDSLSSEERGKLDGINEENVTSTEGTFTRLLWQVETIDDKGILKNATETVKFDQDGTLSDSNLKDNGDGTYSYKGATLTKQGDSNIYSGTTPDGSTTYQLKVEQMSDNDIETLVKDSISGSWTESVQVENGTVTYKKDWLIGGAFATYEASASEFVHQEITTIENKTETISLQNTDLAGFKTHLIDQIKTQLNTGNTVTLGNTELTTENVDSTIDALEETAFTAEAGTEEGKTNYSTSCTVSKVLSTGKIRQSVLLKNTSWWSGSKDDYSSSESSDFAGTYKINYGKTGGTQTGSSTTSYTTITPYNAPATGTGTKATYSGTLSYTYEDAANPEVSSVKSQKSKKRTIKATAEQVTNTSYVKYVIPSAESDGSGQNGIVTLWYWATLPDGTPITCTESLQDGVLTLTTAEPDAILHVNMSAWRAHADVTQIVFVTGGKTTAFTASSVQPVAYEAELLTLTHTGASAAFAAQ